MTSLEKPKEFRIYNRTRKIIPIGSRSILPNSFQDYSDDAIRPIVASLKILQDNGFITIEKYSMKVNPRELESLSQTDGVVLSGTGGFPTGPFDDKDTIKEGVLFYNLGNNQLLVRANGAWKTVTGTTVKRRTREFPNADFPDISNQLTFQPVPADQNDSFIGNLEVYWNGALSRLVDGCGDFSPTAEYFTWNAVNFTATLCGVPGVGSRITIAYLYAE